MIRGIFLLLFALYLSVAIVVASERGGVLEEEAGRVNEELPVYHDDERHEGMTASRQLNKRRKKKVKRGDMYNYFGNADVKGEHHDYTMDSLRQYGKGFKSSKSSKCAGKGGAKAPTIKSTKAPTIKSTKGPTIKSTKAPSVQEENDFPRMGKKRKNAKSTKAPSFSRDSSKAPSTSSKSSKKSSTICEEDEEDDTDFSISMSMSMSMGMD